MRIAVMQPYFIPYIGYFQLMRAVDLLVLTDSYKYTKGGWINRNRIINNGRVTWVTIPLKKSSDLELINQKELAPDRNFDNLLRILHNAYGRTSFFQETFKIVEQLFQKKEQNLAIFLENAIRTIAFELSIDCEIVCLSSLAVRLDGTQTENLIEICKYFGAKNYLNLPGGRSLYNYGDFNKQDIELNFIDPVLNVYPQTIAGFEPGLSIFDMFFNIGLQNVRFNHLDNYKISRAV